MKVGNSFLGTASQILALVALFSEFNYTGQYIHILGTYILQDLHCYLLHVGFCFSAMVFLIMTTFYPNVSFIYFSKVHACL